MGSRFGIQEKPPRRQKRHFFMAAFPDDGFFRQRRTDFRSSFGKIDH